MSLFIKNSNEDYIEEDAISIIKELGISQAQLLRDIHRDIKGVSENIDCLHAQVEKILLAKEPRELKAAKPAKVGDKNSGGKRNTKIYHADKRLLRALSENNGKIAAIDINKLLRNYDICNSPSAFYSAIRSLKEDGLAISYVKDLLTKEVYVELKEG